MLSRARPAGTDSGLSFGHQDDTLAQVSRQGLMSRGRALPTLPRFEEGVQPSRRKGRMDRQEPPFMDDGFPIVRFLWHLLSRSAAFRSAREARSSPKFLP